MPTAPLEVRLSTVGAAELAAGLQVGANAVAKFNKDVQDSKKATDAMRGAVDGLLSRLASFAAMAGGGLGLGALVRKGFEFNSMMEDSAVTIGALIATFNDFTVGGQKVAGAMEKMNLVGGMTAKIQEQLKVSALTTTASYAEMMSGFTAGFAPMTSAGIKINEMVLVTQRLTQTMGVLKVPMAQLGIEMRQFFEGDTARGRLVRELGLTKKAIDEAVKSGKLFDIIIKKTEEIAEASKRLATTWTGAMSNVKDAVEQTLGAGTKALFEDLKGELFSVFDALVKVTGSGKDMKTELNSGLVQAIEEVMVGFRVLVVIIRDGVIGAFKDLDSAVQGAGGWSIVIERLVKGFTVLVGVLATVAEAVFFALSHPIKTIQGLWTTMLTGIGLAVAGFQENLGLLARTVGADKLGASYEESSTKIRNWALDLGKASVNVADFQSRADTLGQRVPAALALVDAAFAKIRKGVVDVGGGPDVGLDPKAKAKLEELSKAFLKAQKAYEDFAASLEKKVSLAGLSGIALELRKVDEEQRESKAKLEKLALAYWGSSFAGEKKFLADLNNLNQAAANERAAIWKEWAADLRAERAKEEAAEEEAFDKIRAQVRGFTLQVTTDWGLVWAELNKTTARTVGEIRERIQALSDTMLNNLKAAGSYSTGVQAGLLNVMASIPTAAESAAAATEEVWGSMAQAFDDSFYSILSGKIDSIGDIFTGLWDSVLKTFSKFLSEQLQRWIAHLLEVKTATANSDAFNAAGGGPRQDVSTGGSGMGTSATVAGGALAVGAGFYGGYSGATDNKVSAGLGGAAMGALSFAAVMLVSGNYIGAAIAAVVAGLLWLASVLVKTNTEIHSAGNFANMLSGQYQKWIKEVEVAETVDRRGNVIPAYTIPGHWETSEGKPTGGVEQAGKGVLDSLQSSLTDIFRMASPAMAGEMTRSYRDAVKAAFSGATFDIAAGSQEDVDKNIESFLKGILPRLALQAGFGQIGYGPHGNRDAPGGVAGIDFGGLPGMDKDGNIIERQLFDPAAPIPRMLAGLGLTAGKIGEIAQRLSTDDPSKFLEYLNKLVGVVVGFRDLGIEMGKTVEELYGEFAAAKSQSPAASFRGPAAAITDLFASLELYSGDEQLTKAAEALQAASGFWEEMKRAIQDVWNLAEQLHAGLVEQRTGMQNAISDLTDPGGAKRRAQTQIDSTWGVLLNSKSPAEVAAAVQAAQGAIQFLFDGLMETIDEATQAAAALQAGITTQRGAIRDFLDPGGMKERAEISIGRSWGVVQNISGERTPAEIAAATEAAQSAIQFLFDGLVESIHAAEQTLASLHASLIAQRAGMGMKLTDLLNPGAAKTRAMNTIDSTWGVIQDKTKSPGEIAAATTAAQEAIAFLFDGLIAVIQEAVALQSSLHSSIQEQRASMRDGLADLVNPGGAEARARATIEGTWGTLQNAKTPGEIAAATKSAQDAIAFLFQGLVERIRAAQETLASVGELEGLFAASGSRGARRTSRTGFGEAAGIRGGVADAAGLSGMAQITAIRKVEAAARSMYESQIAMIRAIDQNVGDLNASIDAQKFSMAFETMTPEQKETSLSDRVRGLMGRIGGAESPEEVKGLTDEIQALISQWFQGVPEQNKAAASVYMGEILDQTRAMANTTYASMREELVSANDEVAEALREIGEILAGNIDDAGNEIDGLTFTLNELDRVVQEELGGMVLEAAAKVEHLGQILDEIGRQVDVTLRGVVDGLYEQVEGLDAILGLFSAQVGVTLTGIVAAAIIEVGKLSGTITAFDGLVGLGLTGIVNDIIAEGALLKAEMEKQKGLFTDIQPPTANLIQPLKDAKDAHERATTAVNGLAAAADTAAGRLRGIGGTATPPVANATTSSSSSRGDVIPEVFAMLRRAPQLAVPRLGR